MMEATFRACRAEQSGRSRKRNLHRGAIVLVKEEGAYRNDWPIRRVSEAIEKQRRSSKKGPIGDSKRMYKEKVPAAN